VNFNQKSCFFNCGVIATYYDCICIFVLTTLRMAT